METTNTIEKTKVTAQMVNEFEPDTDRRGNEMPDYAKANVRIGNLVARVSVSRSKTYRWKDEDKRKPLFQTEVRIVDNDGTIAKACEAFGFEVDMGEVKKAFSKWLAPRKMKAWREAIELRNHQYDDGWYSQLAANISKEPGITAVVNCSKREFVYADTKWVSVKVSDGTSETYVSLTGSGRYEWSSGSHKEWCAKFTNIRPKVVAFVRRITDRKIAEKQNKLDEAKKRVSRKHELEMDLGRDVEANVETQYSKYSRRSYEVTKYSIGDVSVSKSMPTDDGKPPRYSLGGNALDNLTLEQAKAILDIVLPKE